MFNIGDALYSLGARNFVLLGEPSNQHEFEQMFKVVLEDRTPELPVLGNGSSHYSFTWVAVSQELNRLRQDYESKEYQRMREKEYPDVREYLDGIVKGDQAQIDAYVAACQAVKNKYPKPEGV